MKVTGFTIIRNAVKYDYPVIESIQSILSICDEFIVSVGDSDDGTLDLIKSIKSEKIKIIQTQWDDTLRAGGKVLAVETDKAYREISPDTTWAFYIQSDEIVHEKYLDTIREAMLAYKNDNHVDGLLFKYKHFYGSYNFVADARKWYRQEIRIIRNKPTIRAYRDAQGFRFANNKKLRVKAIDAYIFHYGWVKPPQKMAEKIKGVSRFWHTDEEINEKIKVGETFDYSKIDSLQKFEETHPKVMQERINQMAWQFNFDIQQKSYNLKNKILLKFEQLTGWRIGEYKNFIKI